MSECFPHPESCPCDECKIRRENRDIWSAFGASLEQTDDVLAELTTAQARIQELEAECATNKTEISCLTCGNKFSVLNGEEEVNWTCPVCQARGRIKELEGVLQNMVLVRKDDLEWIVSLTERKSQDAKFSPKFIRLVVALEKTP